MLLFSRKLFNKSLNSFNTSSSKVKQFGKAILNNHGYVETLSSGIINAKGLNKVALGELVKIWPSNIYVANFTSSWVNADFINKFNAIKSG